MRYLALLTLLLTTQLYAERLDQTKLNVVFITLDDLSYESLGINGCKVPDISPNMDRIANSGMRFEGFHVQASNCIPSRALMMTGMYQQHNKIFSLGKAGAGNQIIRNTLPTVFNDAGYHTGIMGKNSHHNPFDPYTGFDVEYDSYGSTKYPAKVYEKTKLAIADSSKLNKPLFFNLNIYDPHVGWYGWSRTEGTVKETENHPSRIYTPDEIPYPSWFPPLAEKAKTGPNKRSKKDIHIMEEVTAYYNTVKRADDSIGQMLRAFDEAGITQDTVFILISDHGAELPGGKTTLYNEGTHSPLFISWPGITKPGTVHKSELIGSIDLLPTFCDMLNEPIPADLDGRSFLPMILGQTEKNWRPFVYIQQNDRNKARAIQTKDGYLYIVNAWHGGETKFGSVSTGTLTWNLFKLAQQSPENDPLASAWINKLEYRVPHELYDIKNDPSCFKNLVHDPSYKNKLREIRETMIQEAEISGDHIALAALRNPESAEARAETVNAIDADKATRISNPDYARRAHYDPYDGSLVLDNTLFEGVSGIWNDSAKGLSLETKGGSKELGPGALKVDGNKSNSIRIETSRSFNARQFNNIKFAFTLNTLQAPKAKKSKGKKTQTQKLATRKEKRVTIPSPKGSLSFEYNNGSGWQSLEKAPLSKFLKEQNLSFKKPKKGFSTKTKFAISIDFTSPGILYLDGFRLATDVDWKSIKTPNQQVLKAGESLELTRDLIDFSELEVSYNFSAEKAQAKFVLEYFDKGKWLELNSHDYKYVLQANKKYVAFAKIKAKNMLGKELKVRFRNLTSVPVEINDLQVRKRSSI
ncbi:sulfatase-like hydrolase/transferase [Lentisphaera profundi]|uniref:Sulfatase-like hydrolase/transferase n=1 Tax=Lentisphaera profundi TaxID=1658616 RepID=A0ABY7VWF3_9BACT|nr:sulfatase-like hydrolase/transferase [Lentisphaera profundi]WDE98417.1 sulfatase-like hydrolase/transferase [Lentisphaera profundi]